jgi:hypothetical protein
MHGQVLYEIFYIFSSNPLKRVKRQVFRGFFVRRSASQASKWDDDVSQGSSHYLNAEYRVILLTSIRAICLRLFSG